MATPYSQLPWGFRRGEGNYQYQEFLKRRMEAERQADFADRIAAEKERISLSRWSPEPEEQEVKIKTKSDGTSTIVSTEKYPGISQDELAQEQLRQGGYGLTYPDEQTGILGTPYEGIGDLTWEDVDPTLFQLDQDPGIVGPRQDLYPGVPPGARFDPERRGVGVWPFGTGWTATGVGQDFSQVPDAGVATLPGGQTVGEATAAAFPDMNLAGGDPMWPGVEEEVVVSPEGTPISGFDMGGLQRFEPHIIPDEAYRQAYGDQERVMGMRGLLEEEIPPVIVPPPTFQTIEPQPQMPMVDRAIEQADRGTANILPPIDFPPVQPGAVGAEVPFVPAQAITPEQGPLGPPMLAGVSPEMELQAALAAEPIMEPAVGLLADPRMEFGPQDITAGLPEGGTPLNAMWELQNIGLLPTEEAAPLTSEDIFGGVSPEVSLDPVDPGLRPRGRVETDILESQAKGYIDPDTGLPPERRPKGVPALKDETAEERRIRLRREAEGLNLSDVDTEMLGLPEVAETLSDMYKMQKRAAMVQFANMLKEQQKKKVTKIRGVGRRRQGQQHAQLLNPTPLGMGDQYG